MPDLSLELPVTVAGLSDEARRLLNDRLRRIAEQFASPITLEQDLNAAGKRITNLTDPRDGADALSKNAAAKMQQPGTASSGGGSSTTNNSTTVTADTASTVILTVPGTLSVRSSAAPLVSLAKQRNVSEVVALLKRAPQNADVKLDVLLAGVKWASLTVAANQTTAKLSSSLAAIAKDAVISLDLTQVGTVFPGADLTVMIRLA